MITNYWLNTMMRLAFSFGVKDLYVGLSSTEPDQYGIGVTEPENTNYARMKVGKFSSPENGEVHNASDIVFPASVTSWFPANNKAQYWCLFDGAGESSALVACGPLSHAVTVESQVAVRIPAGQISITLNDYDTTASHVVMLDDGTLLTNSDGEILLFSPR